MNTNYTLSRVLRGIGGRLWWFLMIPAMFQLSRKKAYQRTAFYSLRDKFGLLYGEMVGWDYKKFSIPFWEAMNSRFAKVLLPQPPFSFLQLSETRATMFGPYKSKLSTAALGYLEQRLSQERLDFLLQEDYVGKPTLVNSKYRASGNTIFHLYHFMRFADNIRCNFEEITTVVDWGGGYGSMARLFDRLATKPYTYIIIDTPLFSCLQWLYLSSILGEQRVHILNQPQSEIEIGKINLLPLCFLEQVRIRCDLFISTWALSESSEYAQDYVVGQDWFGARHALLAFQSTNNQFKYANRLGQIAGGYGAKVEEMNFFPSNYYAMF